MPIPPQLDLSPAFEDFDTWQSSLPETQRQAVERRFAWTPPEELETERRRFLSVGLISQRTGKDAAEVATNLETIYLPAFSTDPRGLGQPAPVKDVSQFYTLAKGRLMAEKATKEAEKIGADEGYLAALTDQGSLAALSSMSDDAMANPDQEAKNRAKFAAYRQAADALAPYRGDIVRAGAAYDRIMTGKALPDDQATVDAARERVLDMPDLDRKLVMQAFAVQAKQMGEGNAALKSGRPGLPFGGKGAGPGFLQQIGESAYRFGAAGLNNSMQAELLLERVPDSGEVRFSGAAITTPEEARQFVRESMTQAMSDQASLEGGSPGGAPMGAMDNRPMITLNKKASKLVKEAKQRVAKGIQVDREFSQIANSTDPVTNVFASTIGTSVAAVGTMALTRGYAAPIMAQAYRNIEYDDLSLKYPGMPAKDKALVAGLSGGIQAALDYAGFKVLDKLPGLKSLIGQPMTKALAGRATARAGLTYLQENIIEGGQDAATPLLMQALASDVPGYDWNKEMKEWWGGRVDVALGMIPLTLLGMGAASVREYAGGKELLSRFEEIKKTGVKEAAAVEIVELAQDGKLEEAQAKLQEAWGSRDPEAARAAQEAGDAQQAEQTAAVGELQRLGMLPDFSIERGKVTVRSGENVATFPSWEAARPVIVQHMTEIERSQADLVASLAESFIAGTPSTLVGESFNVQQGGETLIDRVKAGASTPEQAMEAAVAGGVLKGLTMAEARQIAKDVFGDSQEERAVSIRKEVEKLIAAGRNEVALGESKNTINLQDNHQAFLTAVEEPVEGRWKAGVATGRFTKEQGLRFVDVAEKITGQKFLLGMTADEVRSSAAINPRSLVEAVSAVVVADVFGRLQDGKRIGPGSISGNLDLSDREQSAFAAILNAFRQFFKTIMEAAAKLSQARKEGKLDGEYTMLLDALTGDGAQFEYERGVAKESEALAKDAALKLNLEESYALTTREFEERIQKAFSEFQSDPIKRRALARVAQQRIQKVSMEVLEAGDKSTAETMRGWLRVLDAALSAAPSDVRAKVGGHSQIASFKTERGMFNEVERRIAKLDREFEKWLVKESLEAFDSLFSKASPNGEGGKKQTGKIGVDAHRWFAAVEAASSMNEAKVLEQLNNIDAMLSGAIPAAEVQSLHAADLISSPDEDLARDHLESQRGILISYGNLKGKTASELDSILRTAEHIYSTGRLGWKQKQIREREARKELRDSTVIPEANLTTPSDYELSMVEEREAIEATGFWKRMFSSGFTFLGQLDKATSKLSAEKSKTALWAERMSVAAELGYKDGMHERTAKYQDFIRSLFPGKTLGGNGRLAKLEKLATRQDFEAANKKLHLSQLEAVHFTMLWKQEGLQEALDANGYGALVQADLEQWLTPEARKIRTWLWNEYDTQYGRINKIYKDLYGIDLPRVAFYAPAFFETHGQQPVLSYDGSGTDTRLGGMGHLKTRINHNAKPRQVDAVSAWIQNAHVVEHWLNWAKPMKELRAVLGHKETMAAIRAGAGPQAMSNILDHMEILERGGLREAAAHQASSELLRRWRQGTRDVALAGKLVTIGKQLPAAYAAASDIGVLSYLRGAGRVLSGRSKVSYWDMLQSRTIQRRIDQLPDEWKVSMQGFRAKSKAYETMLREKLGAAFDYRGVTLALDFFRTKPGQVDAALTAFSASVAYDQHWQDAKALGMSAGEATAEAWAKTEATVLNTAQPDSILGKSLFENQMGEIGKGAFLFQSANRQNLFLTILSFAKGNKAEGAQRFAINWMLTGLVSQTIANVGRMLFSDDDTDEIWETSDYLRSILIGPLTGAMYFGVALETLFHSFGWGFAPRVAANPISATLTEADNILDQINEGDISPNDIGKAASKLGVLLGGNWAAFGVSWNILKQALGFADRLEQGGE